jgi:hypothetical protein
MYRAIVSKDWLEKWMRPNTDIRSIMYICENGTWQDGGRLRTYFHHSPTGDLVFSNSRTGTGQNDWRWHGAASPPDWAHPNNWRYHWLCSVDVVCLMVSHLVADPPFYVIIGVLQRHFLSFPVPWWLLYSAQQPFPSTPNLTSLHLNPVPELVRLVHHLPLLIVIVDVMINYSDFIMWPDNCPWVLCCFLGDSCSL